MTLAGLFRRKPKKPEPEADMGRVLCDVKRYVSELGRQNSELDRQLTKLKEHPHG